MRGTNEKRAHNCRKQLIWVADGWILCVLREPRQISSSYLSDCSGKRSLLADVDDEKSFFGRRGGVIYYRESSSAAVGPSC